MVWASLTLSCSVSSSVDGDDSSVELLCEGWGPGLKHECSTWSECAINGSFHTVDVA